MHRAVDLGILTTTQTRHHARMSASSTDEAPITVAEALTLTVVKRGLPQVVAGHENLDRPIRWAHAGEVPKIASLLSGGELLLTTGMGIGSHADAQRRFATELADRRVAAVVVELGEVLPAIPEPLREAAEARKLPLIALRREVHFVDVTEAIHTEIVNRQHRLLRRGQEFQEQLVAIMLAGDGLPEVLGALSRALNGPVYLESGDGRLLFHAGDPEGLTNWEALRTAPDDDALAGLSVAVPMGSGNQPGRLIARRGERPLLELDRIALDHGAAVIALALLRARQEEELFVRERGNVLDEIVRGTITGTRAERQAALLGFRAEHGLLLPVAADVLGDVGDLVWSAALHDLYADLRGRGLTSLSGARANSGQLLALVAMRRPEDREDVARVVAEAIQAVARRRKRDVGVIVGVAAITDWAGVSDALLLACDAAACARGLPQRPWFDAGALELQLLLWRLRHDDALASFVHRNLGPLLDHDRQRKHELLPTLLVLCENGGRKAESARALHLNRQALYHRIGRIENLLEVDLSDAAQLVTLTVALDAMRYVDLTALGTDRRG